MHRLSKAPEKKLAIYLAAAKVFGNKGFYRTTIEEIAQEANIGKSTVYEYVQSKEQLFADLLNQGFDFYLGILENNIRKTDSLEEKFRAFINSWLVFIENHYNFYKVILSDYYDPCRDETRNEIFNKIAIRIKTLLADAVTEGVKNEEIRDVDLSLIVTSLIGILMGVSSIFKTDALETEKLADNIIDILLHGIMVKA